MSQPQRHRMIPTACCPACRRQRPVARGSMRLLPHKDPATGAQCAGSRAHVDLNDLLPAGHATPEETGVVR